MASRRLAGARGRRPTHRQAPARGPRARQPPGHRPDHPRLPAGRLDRAASAGAPLAASRPRAGRSDGPRSSALDPTSGPEHSGLVVLVDGGRDDLRRHLLGPRDVGEPGADCPIVAVPLRGRALPPVAHRRVPAPRPGRRALRQRHPAPLPLAGLPAAGRSHLGHRTGADPGAPDPGSRRAERSSGPGGQRGRRQDQRTSLGSRRHRHGAVRGHSARRDVVDSCRTPVAGRHLAVLRVPDPGAGQPVVPSPGGSPGGDSARCRQPTAALGRGSPGDAGGGGGEVGHAAAVRGRPVRYDGRDAGRLASFPVESRRAGCAVSRSLRRGHGGVLRIWVPCDDASAPTRSSTLTRLSSSWQTPSRCRRRRSAWR